MDGYKTICQDWQILRNETIFYEFDEHLECKNREISNGTFKNVKKRIIFLNRIYYGIKTLCLHSKIRTAYISSEVFLKKS